jgi:hypothetical protein
LEITLRTIISGGQTGVDRGALDAALAVGSPAVDGVSGSRCRGWADFGSVSVALHVKPDKTPELKRETFTA